MSTTCRALCTRALRFLGVVAAGRQPTSGQAADALAALQSLVLAAPAMLQGNQWTEVDITAAYTAGEDERIRVATPDAVTVSLPDTVTDALTCEDRAPRNGARVHVLDLYSDTSTMYFYRSDKARWVQATDLTLTSDSPFDASLDQGLSALLAATLAPEYGIDLDPMVATMAATGRSHMKVRLQATRIVRADDAFLYLSGAGYPCAR